MKKIEKRIWSLFLLLAIEIRLDSSKQNFSIYLSLSSLSSLAFSLSFIPREFKKMSESAIVVQPLTVDNLGVIDILKGNLQNLGKLVATDEAAKAELNHLCSLALAAAEKMEFQAERLRESDKTIKSLTVSVDNAVKSTSVLGETIKSQAEATRASTELANKALDFANSSNETHTKTTGDMLLKETHLENDITCLQEQNKVWKDLFSQLPKFLAKFGMEHQTCKQEKCQGCCRKSENTSHKTLNRTQQWNMILYKAGVPQTMYNVFALPN